MTRSSTALIATAALLGAAFFVYSQPQRRAPEYPPWETKVLTPVEVTPAHYVQVSQRDIDVAAADGWELVSVAPFVLLNEARGKERRDTVTQSYAAYYFKRPRRDR
jgi:hypothetical protein